MQLLVVTAAADQTGRTISLLIAGLVGIAAALTALTVWYWRRTDPKRRARARSMSEPEPVELVEPRQDPVGPVDTIGRVDDVEAGPCLPDHAPVGVARPIVASIPPSATMPSTKPRDDRVHGTERAEPRHWVDPDVWVDAFASHPDNTTMPPKPQRPPVTSDGPALASPRVVAEPQLRPVDRGPDPDPDPDAGRRADEQPAYPSGPEHQPDGSGWRPAGHALSDVDWDVVTQAALTKFAETESANSVDITDPSSVR